MIIITLKKETNGSTNTTSRTMHKLHYYRQFFHRFPRNMLSFFFSHRTIKKKNGNPRVRRHQPHAHESDHAPLRGYVRADQNERGMHRK